MSSRFVRIGDLIINVDNVVCVRDNEVSREVFMKHKKDIRFTTDKTLDELLEILDAKEQSVDWIPCSERQPDVNGWYITTISGEICGQDRAFSGMSEFANGKWVSEDDVDETEMTIAWMPLPDPYKGEHHEID